MVFDILCTLSGFKSYNEISIPHTMYLILNDIHVFICETLSGWVNGFLSDL